MLQIIYFEWLHIWRNPYKVVAIVLFIFAGGYGLQNGWKVFQERVEEISKIEEEIQSVRSEAYSWMVKGEKGPEARPWVDVQTPFWAMWYGNHYLFDTPNPLITFSIGQAEYFGYYKRISMWSTAFDSDLTAELSNPERTALGVFDFTFVWLYLLPLLLIVLCYNIQGQEYDLGFLPLINVQQSSRIRWLVQRLGVISFFIIGVLLLFIFFPALVSRVEIRQLPSLILLFLYYAGYALAWVALLGYIIYHGRSQIEQALRMAMVWLVLCVVIPGIVHQVAQMMHPGSLYLSFIDAQREETSEIYDQPFEEVFAQVNGEFPELKDTYWAKQDSVASQDARNGIYRMALSLHMSEVIDDILSKQEARNTFIRASYWINPVTAIHNHINATVGTDYTANVAYRRKIQKAGAGYNYRLMMDEWNQVSVDTTLFKEYNHLFSN